jgi:dTDP-4-dehydrorhamnose reductase
MMANAEDRPRLLVLGATGLLGTRLVPELATRYEVVTHSRTRNAQCHADLTVAEEAHALLDRIRPSVIINLAALANVDVCQAEPQLAYLSNVKSVEHVAHWIRASGSPCHLIQISTDQVYDGYGPHAEDSPNLTNYYGFSKYAGELAALAVSSTVVRTNFFGRSATPGRLSFTDWLANSLRGGFTAHVFDDIQFSPMALPTLAHLLGKIAHQRPVGVFNLGASTGLSKADFAFAFAAEMGLDPVGFIRTPSGKSGLLKAPRPKDMRMDCRKLERALGIELPNLLSEIRIAAMEYQDEQ